MQTRWKRKQLKLDKQMVRDKDGNIVDFDPIKFPIIPAKCKAFMLTLETGFTHSVMEENGELVIYRT